MIFVGSRWTAVAVSTFVDLPFALSKEVGVRGQLCVGASGDLWRSNSSKLCKPSSTEFSALTDSVFQQKRIGAVCRALRRSRVDVEHGVRLKHSLQQIERALAHPPAAVPSIRTR